MKKKLIFYWYVKPSGWCDIYDLHIANLNTYKDIFDDTLFVISHDYDTDNTLINNTKGKIKSIFPNTDFCDYKNSKEDRESKYFYNEIVLKFNSFNEDDAIFFAHNKGVDSVYVTADDLLCWINTMYYFNLSDKKTINDMLDDSATCAIGTARMDNYAPHVFASFLKYRWMFTGTFFWIVPRRISAYITKNKLDIISNKGRYYTEGFLGTLFPHDAKEVKCIGGNKVEKENFIDYITRNLTNSTIDDFVFRHGKIPYGGDLDIFVFAHKNFETKRINPTYKMVCSNDCDVYSDKLGVIKLDCELSNIGFSEWQKIYEIYTKRTKMLKKYVGLAHYHRYLDFGHGVNFVPSEREIDKIFDNFDVITTEPISVRSLRTQYGACHNVRDFDIVMDIIRTDFPDWYEVAQYCDNAGIMFPSNIMILKKEDFIGLCDFLFPILFKYCERVGIDKTSDNSFIEYVGKYPEEYSKVHKPNDKFNEQARICSFLAERLVVMYYTRYLNRVMVLNFTEK